MADISSGIADYPALIITFIVGATVLVLMYISSLLNSSKSENDNKNTKEEMKKEKHADVGSQNNSHKPSKKKQSEKMFKDSKQNFTHPWLLTSLKGHSGRVLDMDFSANGKFLATCAEDTEELDPGGGGSSEQGSGNSSGSEGNKENSPQGNTGLRTGTLLSRRQKKNRVRREDTLPVTRANNPVPFKKSKAKARRSNATGDGNGNGNRRHTTNAPALRQHAKLNLTDSDLSVFLRHYMLSADQLLGLGYPVESSLYPGRAIIFRNSANNTPARIHSMASSPHFFDVNAQEFVPMSAKQTNPCYYDTSVFIGSQQVNNSMYITSLIDKERSDGSYGGIDVNWNSKNINLEANIVSGPIESDSSDSTKSESLSRMSQSSDSAKSESCTSQSADSDVSGLLTELTVECCKTKNINNLAGQRVPNSGQLSESDEKKCVRCGRGFFVTSDGEYLTQERCLYHWGKLQKVVCPSSGKAGGMMVRTEYTCCRGKGSTRGCATGKLHVWNGIGTGINGPLDAYVRTRQRKTPPPDGNFGVYSLDCEMCFTTRGLELTKVTVVAPDGRLVYDSLVRPENYIIDYNTRFSGITARDLCKRGATKLLKDVQNDLMGFINADTILIGHGLENDLRALRMIHSTVIDTSVIFPHYYGLPYRRSLKSLVGCYLSRNIQQDSSGHDSFEDARACIELMLWRVRKDFRSILENQKSYMPA